MRARAAIVSFHSHGDRSFLDDSTLALLSGDLRRAGVDNDLVVAVVEAGPEDVTAGNAFPDLVALLDGYTTVVYERVWDVALVRALRAGLPGKIFIQCVGEHELEDAPADYVCRGNVREILPRLFEFLQGGRVGLPAGAYVVEGTEQRGMPYLGRSSELPWEPNLDPVVVNASAFSSPRTFSIRGNHGCPYQADARENPVYAGVEIPEGYGRGCAFCVTGNEYVARPPDVTAADVTRQLRYVRTHAPEIRHIVLKDQNPFAYLVAMLEQCGAEGLGGFTLMLETRADWFSRSERRFEDALSAAARSGIRISPFLVGIENFSDVELQRLNKGVTSDALIRFLQLLRAWRDGSDGTLDLSQASYGFILFTPWTRLDDIKQNYEAVVRTRFDELRGALLVSRARLYPDTALYYLARRDGLLVDSYASQAEDSARRYGYFPPHPWRFAHADTAHFAAMAAELHALTGGRDEIRTWKCLLDAFDRAEHHSLVTVDKVCEALGAAPPQPAIGNRDEVLDALLAPIAAAGALPGGWRLRGLGSFRFRIEHAVEPAVELEIRRAGSEPCFRRSRRYAVSYQGRNLNPRQQQVLHAVCAFLARNDP